MKRDKKKRHQRLLVLVDLDRSSLDLSARSTWWSTHWQPNTTARRACCGCRRSADWRSWAGADVTAFEGTTASTSSCCCLRRYRWVRACLFRFHAGVIKVMIWWRRSLAHVCRVCGEMKSSKSHPSPWSFRGKLLKDGTNNLFQQLLTCGNREKREA
jgi:hypothetical protein